MPTDSAPGDANGSPEHLRSSSFDTGRFKPHGEFDLCADGQIARSISKGPFNTELMLAAGQARRALFSRLGAQGPFAAITTMHESILCPLDALDLMVELLRGEDRDAIPKPVAFAWVVSDAVEGKRWMSGRYAEAYRGVGLNFEIFETQEQAEAWVATHLKP